MNLISSIEDINKHFCYLLKYEIVSDFIETLAKIFVYFKEFCILFLN